MTRSVAQKTVIIKKEIPATLSKVYLAFSSVKARSKWAVPKGDAIKYSKAAFKIGGRDDFRCGTPGKLEIRGIVHYHEIVKGKRIISTETISHSNKILSVALVTTEFIKLKNATSVIITAQICSLDGNDMSIGYKKGWQSTLKNLTEYVA